MRRIEIESGLALRFPQRGPDFCDGIEIGMLATLMASDAAVISRTISTTNLEQASVLADKLGYLVAETSIAGNVATLTFRKRGMRPQLRLVSGSQQ